MDTQEIHQAEEGANAYGCWAALTHLMGYLVTHPSIKLQYCMKATGAWTATRIPNGQQRIQHINGVVAWYKSTKVLWRSKC